MYWLLDKDTQAQIRDQVDKLVLSLSGKDNKPIQVDQLFPFVGRKDRRIAADVIRILTQPGQAVCDPFAGSGMLVYATEQEQRVGYANEFEIYTNRMANAPWRLPQNLDVLSEAYWQLIQAVKPDLDELYRTICPCGNPHVLDSLFFDRDPLQFTRITKHERLGKNGENITYRGKQYKCPNCGRTEKHFDQTDLDHLNRLDKRPIPEIFNYPLIENSRINLSSEFTVYYKLFPKRSMLALDLLWSSILQLKYDAEIIDFLKDVFLSILPQAKFKDYRSKSQDLHCPKVQLREVNLLYRYEQQFRMRLTGLLAYRFNYQGVENTPIYCLDFRDYCRQLERNSIDLFFTDPPWADGNAYFEKAQLYHPWLDYSLASDEERMEKEMVITDAPSRKSVHDEARWWQDARDLFQEAQRITKPLKYFALMFRPIKASKWLSVLNKLKFLARDAGFEPLLTIDIDSADPSMRVQQSASYAFVDDLIMLFIKVPETLRRWIVDEHDIDQIVFETAEKLQEEKSASVSYKEWRKAVAGEFEKRGLHELNIPKYEDRLHHVFTMYCDEVEPQRYLTKHLTPFSGQLFDVPVTERIFIYVPKVVEELAEQKEEFSYSEFILKLSQFLENGTRSLISEVSDLDMENVLETYAEQVPGTKYFRQRRLPKIPGDIKKVMDLDPYQFEIFVGHLFEAQGFSNVVIVGRAGDRGVDLIGKDPSGKMTIIQCKQWLGNNVGTTPVQRLDSFARTRKAERKILVTTSDFTPQGRDEARITETETINGDRLRELIAKHMPEFLK